MDFFYFPCIVYPCEINNTRGSSAKALIENLYTNWKDAVCDLEYHVLLSQILNVKMNHFLREAENRCKRIEIILDIKLREKIESIK